MNMGKEAQWTQDHGAWDMVLGPYGPVLIWAWGHMGLGLYGPGPTRSKATGFSATYEWQAMQMHPDKGGDPREFAVVQEFNHVTWHHH